MEEIIADNLVEINRNLEKLIKVLEENRTPVAGTTDVIQIDGKKVSSFVLEKCQN